MILIANDNGDWWEWTYEHGDLHVLDTDDLSPENEASIAKILDTPNWREELLNTDKLDKLIKAFGSQIELDL